MATEPPPESLQPESLRFVQQLHSVDERSIACKLCSSLCMIQEARFRICEMDKLSGGKIQNKSTYMPLWHVTLHKSVTEKFRVFSCEMAHYREIYKLKLMEVVISTMQI